MKKSEQKQVLEKIEALGREILKEIENKENPKLEIPIRTRANIYFDEKEQIIKIGDKKAERYFLNTAHAKKFMQTLLILGYLKKLIEKEGRTLSIRQLFYVLRHTIPGLKEDVFNSQDETDPIIEDIEVMLDVLRENLNLIPTPKGVIAGPLVVYDKKFKQTIDYTKQGAAGGAVPAIVEADALEFKECSAKYVLVVEKFATWNNLNEAKYWDKENCILLTGKGQAARAERRLVARLAHELKLPVYVFTDLDAAGYYIYSVYKYGSMNLAFLSEKSALPTAKFLGFQMKDIKQFDIPRRSWIKQTKWDLKRLKELKGYPWFQKKEWKKELNELEKFKYKIEQDALVAKHIDFMAKEYLPTKIENKDFLP